MLGTLTTWGCSGPAKPDAGGERVVQGETPEVRTVGVPGTTLSFDLVRIPSGTVGEGDEAVEVGPLWVLTTEVTWDLYDVFVYALDEPEEARADAVARPSKPYIPPDRGFGHAGYPAISMTRKAAEAFCEWLEGKTGVAARLPTPAEFTHLASAGSGTAYWFGDEPALVGDHAWCAINSDATSHPVATKGVNPFGLADTHGNVAEWVITDTRKPIAMGGGFLDEPVDCSATSSQRQTSSWNSSDPQIPKSQWWLADCSWVGFRFVVDAEPGVGAQEHSDAR